MIRVESEKDMPRIQKPDKDGYVEHVICEGARSHVVSYDGYGAMCNIKNCEINKRREKLIQDSAKERN